jgi:hypothetical protein
MKRLLRVQPGQFIAAGAPQLIHCLEPAFLSGQPGVVGALCEVLAALYAAFNVGAPELPQEVRVSLAGTPSKAHLKSQCIPATVTERGVGSWTPLDVMTQDMAHR